MMRHLDERRSFAFAAISTGPAILVGQRFDGEVEECGASASRSVIVVGHSSEL
jgi:hypothetical protein